MDRPYSHGHSESSPPLLPSTQTSFSDVFTIESSPTRQQRLLQNRHARFPAKKLSISGLSNKLTQLIGNNDQSGEQDAPTRNQENKLHKSRSTGTIGKKASLAVLEEISNAARGRTLKKRTDISIYRDNAERPLLETSPLVASSPIINLDSRFDFTSPINFDHIQDSFNDMRIRDRSFQDPWSPVNKSPQSLRVKHRKRSTQAQFNAEEYIEHIEKELQQIRDEAYSPLTRRPVKEKLRAANKESERLQNELSQLKEAFEAEVKRTVEHKTHTEAELKRRVRDLEDSLEEKEQTIRDLQHHHEDKRLDDSVIDSLKATIQRLESEKQDMEEINLSMNKRNEVLTQLLAMSPTRTNPAGFNLGSPVREKRNARPFSLVLPRQPVSPRAFSQASSVACSPHPVSSSAISPLKLSPTPSNDGYLGAKFQSGNSPEQPDLQQADIVLRSPRVQDSIHRRWTILSDVSAASNSGNEDLKPVTRRKTRKFMAGSTQLKPLLLPTLTGDNLLSASTMSSPRSLPAELDYATDFDDTVLPISDINDLQEPNHMEEAENDETSLEMSFGFDEGPGPAYQRHPDAITTGIDMEPTSNSEELVGLGLPLAEYDIYQSPCTRRQRLSTMDGMQMMPMPSTPVSLAALPLPLFSPARQRIESDSPADTGSPNTSSATNSLHLEKKRKSIPADHGDSPQPRKVPRHAEYRPPTIQAYSEPPIQLPSPDQRIRSSSLTGQIRKGRSSDNALEILRAKNFAAKPLAALTIKTLYSIISSCTKTARDLKRDPFAVARRLLANAWFMNWRLLGKVSWWVLGLFVQPQNAPRVRPPIDWDQYDGESIASKYCRSDVASSDLRSYEDDSDDEDASLHSCQIGTQAICHPLDHAIQKKIKPGWTQSLFLWGKFSAAMMLAVSGAVINGPGEILKDIKRTSSTRSSKHRHCKGCGNLKHDRRAINYERSKQERHTIACHSDARKSGIFENHDQSHSEDAELDSSSILQQIQQTDLDSTLKPPQPRRPDLSILFTSLSSP